jgi:hypothetical protein
MCCNWAQFELGAAWTSQWWAMGAASLLPDVQHLDLAVHTTLSRR